MKQVVAFKLPDDDSTILIEVDEPQTPGQKPINRPVEDSIKQAEKTFTEALDNLKPMFKAIKQKFDDMNEPANEVEVKFALKLNGKVGAIITAGGEASYEITLRWNKK